MHSSTTFNIINTSAKIAHKYKLNVAYDTEEYTILDLIVSRLEHTNIYDKNCDISTDWSLCVSTNYLDRNSIRNIMFKEYVNGLMMIDHLPMSYLKKEDFIIINNVLQGVKKLCFNNHIQQSWPLALDMIPIGIPEYSINPDTRKSIILLSNKNKRQCRIIHQQMLEILPDAGIMTEFADLDSVAENLNMYKVALIFDGYTNVVFATSCGCSIISNNNYGYDHIMTFKDSNSLNHSIQQSLKHYDYQYNLDLRQQILESYRFDVFDKQISEIFIQQAKEPFVVS